MFQCIGPMAMNYKDRVFTAQNRSIEEMPSDAFQKAMGALQKTIDDKKPARADLEDEIPY